MSPQQKAQIQARIERVNAQRAVLTHGVNAQIIPEDGGEAGSRLSAGKPEDRVAPAADESSAPIDRHKPGYMAAYMREWRAKQKAKA